MRNMNILYVTPTARKLILLLLLCCSVAAFAKERYYARILPEGKMYFFMPCKLPAKAGNKLQYDMTLISYCDSVTINMTLRSPMGRVGSISLTAGDVSYTTKQYELFFQEREGSRFNTRVHIDCPNDIYRQLFSSPVPLTIELTMESGAKYAFTYKAKQWQRETVYVSEVLEMIAYSNSRK